MKIALISLYFFFYLSHSFAQILNGYVFDENNNPLVSANIHLSNTNIGTTTNLDGHFLIKLKEGRSTLIFSYIGFINDTLNVLLDKNEVVSKKINMKQSHIALPGVVIYAFEYNEAEKIIRNVTHNKNDYLKKLRNYIYDAYTKTVLLVPSNDSLLFGGITQTLSKGFYQYPDKFQEVILTKNQTKNITEAHNVFSIGKIPNILEERLSFDEEKIISPLNSNALNYYSYDIIDTTFLYNKEVFNIKFIPKNENLPLFSGNLSIVDELFVPVKVELYGQNNIITKIRKDIVVKQQFREYESEFWLPVEIIYNSKVDMGIPGIPPVYFNQLSLISDYNINDTSFLYTFDKYILKQSIVSDNQADSLWQSKQIVPLTNEETKAFSRIDSIVTNASLFTKIAIGLTQSLTALNTLPFTSFNDFYHFNRVEGNYLGIGFDSKNNFVPLQVKFKLGYGISDDKGKYFLSLNYNLRDYFFVPFIEIYDQLTYADKFYNYSIFDLTYQSLFFKNDYADYFYAKGLNLGFELNINDYARTKISAFSEKQVNASVNTNFSLFNKDQKYRSPFLIQDGKINAILFSFEYNNQKYYDYGFIKVPDYSDNFTHINLDYLYGSKVFNSDYSFHQIHLEINRFQKITSYLNLNLAFKSGILLNDKINQYKFHIPGNYGTLATPIVFRTILSDQFIGDSYFILFVENNFKNTLFNLLNIPFLEHNKYDLLFYFNWGTINRDLILQENISHQYDYYYEIGFGIGNILSLLRLDLTWCISKQNTNSFVVSLLSTL
ncbi:MAG: DUF5686 family protein [Bacteroidota bacterium]|nr:DUF5686 family protein [Bacteroidota bacterium]